MISFTNNKRAVKHIILFKYIILLQYQPFFIKKIVRFIFINIFAFC